MKTALAVGLGLVAVALLFLLLKRRSRRRYSRSLGKHPTGFKKYHLHTETRIKKRWDGNKDASDKSVAHVSFKGDVKASGRVALSQIVDEILLNQDDLSEVVVCVESPGGMVAEYGHAYSELKRIREAGLKLTVCIDTVAASGGYLMSLPAHQVLAAPFALVGSIGVVSFVPNIRKLLERFDILPRTFTAGEYKRTVTLTDENDPETVAHYQKQLALIHAQFKEALKEFRPHVELDRVATGEAWLAKTSMDLKLGLVDEIKASSTYLLEKNKEQALVQFSVKEKERALRKFMRSSFSSFFDHWRI